MTDLEYAKAQSAADMCGMLLSAHDWREFIRRLDHADAIGSVIDPTTYRAAMEAIPLIRQMAEASLKLVTARQKWEAVLEKQGMPIIHSKIVHPSNQIRKPEVPA